MIGMEDGGAGSRGIDGRVAQLADVLRSFADATTDPARLVDTIASRTATLLGQAISIRLLSADGSTLEPAVLYDPAPGDGDLRASGRAAIPVAAVPGMAEALANGTTLLVRDIADASYRAVTAPLTADARRALDDARITSSITAPMHARGECVGTIFVVSRAKDRQLEERDREIVEAIASHAALTLANARTIAQLTSEIEERRRAETSLAATEQARAYQRSIIDTLSHPLLVLDPEGRVRTANRAFCLLFGVSEAEVVEHPWYAIANASLDVPRMRALLEGARGATASDVEAPVVIPGQGRRILKVAMRRMRPGDGAAWGSGAHLLAIEDVTERTETAEVLERRAILFESMGEAVFAGDFELRINEANPAAERLFGWTAGEVRNRKVQDALELSGYDRAEAQARLLAGETIRRRGQVHHRAGHIIDVEVSSTPVKRAGVLTGFVCVMQDITERLRLEQAAEEQLAALKHANEELEGFSYSVSHDLRAPIRAIEGFSRLLEEDYGEALDDEGRRLLGVVRKNARRMGMLIDDLLDFSRLGRRPLETATVDMTTLARETLELACAAEPGREFEVSVDDLPGVSGDRSLLEQVWKNLFENAVKYTRGRAPAVIRITADTIDPETIFHVRDNGVGFDMQYVNKLFGVFERLHTDAAFEGTGVGLALVERIVRRHGGRVWAESAEGQGASFHFSLPSEGPTTHEEGREG